MNIVLPDLAAGQSAAGVMGSAEVEALQKALTAGYGTDPAQFTGGSALRIQSLDKTMYATIQENKHFRLFNALVKTNATATVDEWTEQSGVGGFLGGSTNTETGNIRAADGQYARRTALVKYLMTRREVSFVATLGNNIASAEAVEQSNGAVQLLSDAEYLCFEGDSAVVPTEFDGIFAQIAAGVAAGQVDGSNILDAEAQSLASINLINKAAAQIAGFGNFGTPTHIFMSQLVQSDFDTGLDPAFRVALDQNPNSLMLGAPVAGIKTSWGNIATMPDVFVREDLRLSPFELLYPAVAAANAVNVPAAATTAVASDAASKFGAPHAGNYFYAVAGINADGTSTVLKTTVQAVTAGQKVTLTITKSTAGTETGYVIYRSRLNGTNATADFREMVRVPRTGASTVYVDLNRDIPGTTKAAILNMSQGGGAISWRQFLPMLKFPLYPTVSATVPWAQLLFGYLRLTKRRHHVVIKNILPNGSTWRPFN
jgi:hypothetical protein